MQSGVINARHIASARWLVFFWAQGKGVDIDTGVWGTSVVLVRLDKVKVSTFTLREAILAVKLKLGSDNRVLAPAVFGHGAFDKDKGTSVGDTRIKTIGDREWR